MEKIRAQLAAIIEKVFGVTGVAVELMPAPEGTGADLATNVAMRLAKPVGKAPREVAEDLRRELVASGELAGVEVTVNAYCTMSARRVIVPSTASTPRTVYVVIGSLPSRYHPLRRYFDVSKQVGSSTMAQKRNPMNSENVCGLARVIRGFVTPAFESQILWHERDLCNSSTERFTLPHVFVLIDEILKKTAWIYSGLEIHRDRMLENIESSRGLVMAEPLMMKLTEKGIGRQDAHEIIRSSAMVAEDTGRHLRDVLMEREDLKGVLTPEEIVATMDASNYVGGAREIVDKMVAAAEDVVGRKVERWTGSIRGSSSGRSSEPRSAPSCTSSPTAG